MTKTVPDRVANFGSTDVDEIPIDPVQEITVDNLDSHADKLPKPTGYRVLILPFTLPEQTKGGIYLAKQTLDKERIATVVGYVVAMGADAYAIHTSSLKVLGVKKGDWVIFGRYAGARFQIEGGDMRLLNDDEILATIEDPEAILS